MRHAVSIVAFRSDPELVAHTITSALAQSRPPDHLVVLVSGHRPGDGLLAAVEAACASAGTSTRCEVLARGDNLGFAGGHNYLAARVFEQSADFLTLVNPDLHLEPHAFEEFWRSVEEHAEDFAVHGPHLVSPPRPGESQQRVDSAGIVWSGDGRHFDHLQDEPLDRLPAAVTEVSGVTGALLTVSRSTHEHLRELTGEFLDPLFLAYREDAELGHRVRALGGRCLLHPTRGFVHARGARNAERTSDLQRLLGVQNRFLLRSRMGTDRPGHRGRALLRDVVVVAAVLLRERGSRPGLRRAWDVRRFERAKGRATRAADRGERQ